MCRVRDLDKKSALSAECEISLKSRTLSSQEKKTKKIKIILKKPKNSVNLVTRWV